jgi:outer membrane protein assembly factor BamB
MLSRLPGFSSPVMRCLILYFLFVNVPLFSGKGAMDDWPYWRGPGRNSISSEKGWNPKALEGGADILWESRVGEGYSSVTVKDGFLYTMGNIKDNDIVYCLRADTGEEIWQFTYDCPVKGYPGTFATPVIEDGSVYTMSRNGDVHCLDAETGNKKWFVNIVTKFRAEKPKYGFSGSTGVLVCVDVSFQETSNP